jgi:hypothetical protein
MTNHTIPENSDLTAQFNEVEVVRTGSKGEKNSYKLIARGEALGVRWLQTSPSRKTGTFVFDSITGKGAWRDLFGKNTPNSFLTSEGRSISFDTGYFRKTRSGDYVSRISLNEPSKDIVTGLWKNASLFIDSTANDDPGTSIGSVTGFGLLPTVCDGSSISPVVITNYTSIAQTGSITVNPGLEMEVGVFPTAVDANNSQFSQCSLRNPNSRSSGTAIQENFTLQPGQTAVYYLGLGGTGHDLVFPSHNIAIGGLPSGASNASWYDFWLDITSQYDFESLTLNYQGTGGSGDNGQNGFNVTMVTQTANPDGSTTFQNSDTILSPFSKTNTNGSWNGSGQAVIYGFNQPIGLAWID